MEIKGFVNINKPTGLTSSDVVIKVRNAITRYSGEKCKAGHLGTLDPGGAGVLPVGVGKASRLFDYFLTKDKVYRADFAFGKSTDTLDSFGKVNGTGRVPTLGEIMEVIPSFVGDIYQTPPMYSALSIDGRRLYDLAREGKEVDIPRRRVHIYSIDYVASKSDCVHTFDIHASAGTYIRTLVSDIARSIGTVAYMASIIRLRSGSFTIENSVTLDDFMSNIGVHIIGIDEILKNEPYIKIDDKYTRHVLNGIKLDTRRLVDGVVDTNIDYKDKEDLLTFLLCHDFVVRVGEDIVGIGEINEDKVLNIKARLL